MKTDQEMVRMLVDELPDGLRHGATWIYRGGTLVRHVGFYSVQEDTAHEVTDAEMDVALKAVAQMAKSRHQFSPEDRQKLLALLAAAVKTAESDFVERDHGNVLPT